MTTPVAAPRFIRSPSLATAGSIAIAANHEMSRVKITEPPSSSTNHRNAPSATTAAAASPARHTLPGSKVIDVPGPRVGDHRRVHGLDRGRGRLLVGHLILLSLFVPGPAHSL